MKTVKYRNHIKLITFLLLTFCWSHLNAASIFILHSYSQEYNWTKRQHNSFVQHLEHTNQPDLLVTTEYLDTKRHVYDDVYAQEMYRHLKLKYAGYSPDVIYVTDDNALQFARSYLTHIFPKAPIVFSGVNNYTILSEIDPGRITGVFEKKEIIPNIEIMNTIGAADDKLVFVGDTSNTYQAIEHEIREELKKHTAIKAEFISENLMEEIVSRLQQCQCKYVYLTTIGGIKDSSGNSLSLKKIVTRPVILLYLAWKMPICLKG
jgi:hypothetical protein